MRSADQNIAVYNRPLENILLISFKRRNKLCHSGVHPEESLDYPESVVDFIAKAALDGATCVFC